MQGLKVLFPGRMIKASVLLSDIEFGFWYLCIFSTDSLLVCVLRDPVAEEITDDGPEGLKG